MCPDPGPPAQERREYPRYRVEGVYGTLLFRARARVVNFSVAGVAAEAAERLDVGRTYDIRFLEGEDMLELRGKVLWCHLTHTRAAEGQGQEIDRQEADSQEAAAPPVYRAGIELQDVISPLARQLQMFIETHADMRSDQRVFGRFELKTACSLSLESTYELSLCTVSATGLSIETELLPSLGTVLPLRIELPQRILPVETRVVQVKPLTRVVARHRLREIGLTYTQLPLAGFDLMRELLGEVAAQGAGAAAPGADKA